MWEGVGDWTKTATYWPHKPLRTSPCVILVLLGCSTGGLGAQPLWDMFSFQHLLSNWSGLQTQSGVPRAPSPEWWLSLPHLVSNSSNLQLTDFLSPPSYIIVQSPTQSLEWHVWPGPSAGWWLSLPHLVSNSSKLQLTDFLTPPRYIIVQSPTQSLEWHVWPGRRSIYNSTI